MVAQALKGLRDWMDIYDFYVTLQFSVVDDTLGVVGDGTVYLGTS